MLEFKFLDNQREAAFIQETLRPAGITFFLQISSDTIPLSKKDGHSLLICRRI